MREDAGEHCGERGGENAMLATIERARHEDVSGVLALLERHGLPVDGARDLEGALVVARSKGEIVGAAGLELYADGARAPPFCGR
jgi:hypothetical protein